MLVGFNFVQNEVVCYFDGFCFVFVGVGSGKICVIMQKIVYLIEVKGFELCYIVVVMFMNKVVVEMCECVLKLLEGKMLIMLGKEGCKVFVNQFIVCMFYLLGVQILCQEVEYVGLKLQFLIMDLDDCFGMIQEQFGMIDKGLICKIQSIILLWKNGLIMFDEVMVIVVNEDEYQVVLVYCNYVVMLYVYQVVDFDDLICLLVELFVKNEQVCDCWQNKLCYLLIDEYQDINVCQYELLKQFVGL